MGAKIVPYRHPETKEAMGYVICIPETASDSPLSFQDWLIIEQDAALASLRQLDKRLREMLRRVEWIPEEGLGECMVCGAFGEIPEHQPDCELAALLRED